MPFNKVQRSDGSTVFEQTPNGGNEEFVIDFKGVEVAIGRGTTDADITYIRLQNADGESAYCFPNATQDGITVQASRP